MQNLICFLCLFVCITNYCSGQSPKKYFGKSKILSKGKIIEANSVKISSDSIYFTNTIASLKSHMPLKDVDEIQEFRGDYGTTGMWIGTILGTGVGVAIALGSKQVERESQGLFEVEKTTVQIWPIYVGALGGGLIGLLIGNASEDWFTVYKNNSNNRKISLTILPVLNSIERGISLRVSF